MISELNIRFFMQSNHKPNWTFLMLSIASHDHHSRYIDAISRTASWKNPDSVPFHFRDLGDHFSLSMANRDVDQWQIRESSEQVSLYQKTLQIKRLKRQPGRLLPLRWMLCCVCSRKRLPWLTDEALLGRLISYSSETWQDTCCCWTEAHLLLLHTDLG